MALSLSDVKDQTKVFQEIKRAYSAPSCNWRQQDLQNWKEPDRQWLSTVYTDSPDAFSIRLTPAVSTLFRVDILGLHKDFPREGPKKKIMTWSAGVIGR